MPTAKLAQSHVPSATFQPWVGEMYDSGGLDGLRLLLVGESHYSDPPGDVADTDIPALTRDMVERAIQGDRGPQLFYDKIGKSISGRSLTDCDARNDFWQRVAFCNFFQRLLEGSKAKLTKTDAQEALPVFRDVLATVEPHAVLVTSIKVWNSIKPFNSVTRNEDAPSKTFLWTLDGRSMVATWTPHPSARSQAFSTSRWQERTRRFMDEAREWARDSARRR